jgi:hypothetical protein
MDLILIASDGYFSVSPEVVAVSSPDISIELLEKMKVSVKKIVPIIDVKLDN